MRFHTNHFQNSHSEIQGASKVLQNRILSISDFFYLNVNNIIGHMSIRTGKAVNGLRIENISVGTKLRVKSKEWFEENCEDNGYGELVVKVNGEEWFYFTRSMSMFCGKEMTVEKVVEDPHSDSETLTMFTICDNCPQFLEMKETSKRYRWTLNMFDEIVEY